MGTPLVTKGLVFSGSGFGQEPGILISGVCTPASAQLQGPGRRGEPSLLFARARPPSRKPRGS